MNNYSVVSSRSNNGTNLQTDRHSTGFSLRCALIAISLDWKCRYRYELCHFPSFLELPNIQPIYSPNCATEHKLNNTK